MGAKEFYGPAYTPARAESLEKSFKYLEMAVKADEAKDENKARMAWNAAVKYEGEAFSI